MAHATLSTRTARLGITFLLVLGIVFGITVASNSTADAAVKAYTAADLCLSNAMEIEPGLRTNSNWTSDRYSYGIRLQKWDGRVWQTVGTASGVLQHGQTYRFYMHRRPHGYYRVKAAFAWKDHGTYPSQVKTWEGVLNHVGPNSVNASYCRY